MKLILALAATLALISAPAIAQHSMHNSAEYTVGDLTITGPFSRATLPNAPVGGGYLTITNNGTVDDRLISAASPIAGRVEIHEMVMSGDVMKMRAREDGVPIPAGATVELKPGGEHVMFMDLKQPLVEGETINVTLTFEKAGQIDIPLIIGPSNARDAGHGGMKHGALRGGEPRSSGIVLAAFVRPTRAGAAVGID